MDLLKSHLTNDIGEKYEYKINTSLLEMLKTHLLSKGSRKKRTPSKVAKVKESNSSDEQSSETD